MIKSKYCREYLPNNLIVELKRETHQTKENCCLSTNGILMRVF